MADFEPSPVSLGQRMFMQSDPSFDGVSFAFFAQYFKFDAYNISDTCEWNSKIASSVGKDDIAEIWNLVKLLYHDFRFRPRNIREIFKTIDRMFDSLRNY
jgi:hypothetical protein